MSMSRTAVLMKTATGMDYSQCRRSELANRSWHRLPVPDPCSSSQGRFEALVVHVLAEQLCDRQLDGAVFGVTGIDLRADTPTLILHPRMASRVISLLLPHYDSDYGGIQGLAGARARTSRGRLFVIDQLGEATIELVVARSAALPLPEPRPDVRADWRRPTPTAEEVEERSWWGSEKNFGLGAPADPAIFGARDLLFSRLLRRPRLINLVAGGHGHVNSYTHGDDLVLEWCCGVGNREMRGLLDASGLTYHLPHVAAWNRLGDDPERGSISIDRSVPNRPHGSPLLTLRSGQPCPSAQSRDLLRKLQGKWYA